MLSESAYFHNLSTGYKASLEIESFDWQSSLANSDGGMVKRPKLEPPKMVNTATYVSLWNGVIGVAGGTEVTPQMWGLLSQGDKFVLEALFSVSAELLLVELLWISYECVCVCVLYCALLV